MNWWTSIVWYLWQNSLRRWIEQPLSLVAKLTIAALIGLLGAMMIGGAAFLGDELERQLASRDALTVVITENIHPRHVNSRLSPDDAEPGAWRAMASDILIYDQLPLIVKVGRQGDAGVVALADPEAHGYPDGIVLLSNRKLSGTHEVVTLDDDRFGAFVMPPRCDMVATAMGDNEWVVASSRRLAPLLQSGFTRNILMQAKSIDHIEHVHAVTDTLHGVEGRHVSIRSALPILLELRRIQSVQRYVLLAATLGTALVLGLVCGALAWMEFREERYLLALIRSFGVGRRMLLWHAVAENCLVAVAGVLLGLALLQGFSTVVDLQSVRMDWLGGEPVLFRVESLVLVLGAVCGGLLSCLPIGIGLRKPLGLVLK